MLAGLLNGAAFGGDVIDFSADMVPPSNRGQFVAAIEIAAFTTAESFTLAALFQWHAAMTRCHRMIGPIFTRRRSFAPTHAET